MIGDCNPIDGYLKGGYVVISKNTWNKFGPMNFIDEIKCFFMATKQNHTNDATEVSFNAL